MKLYGKLRDTWDLSYGGKCMYNYKTEHKNVVDIIIGQSFQIPEILSQLPVPNPQRNGLHMHIIIGEYSQYNSYINYTTSMKGLDSGPQVEV